MPENFYLQQLYPLQDRILSVLETLPNDFYLTGGTALSRGYLNHRYSDDLDFFVNHAPDFKTQVDSILKTFTHHGVTFSKGTSSDTFLRIFVIEQEILLKIDFVNDVEFRFGEIQQTTVFSRTDHPLNILTNKLCALSRYEAKDIADILFICKSFSFNWEEMIGYAQKKDIWVEPISISQIIYEFPIEQFKTLKFTGQIDLEREAKCLKKIAVDVLNGSDNSLYGEDS